MPAVSPQIPFGAVYFRKSNPPRQDWERDYGIAAEDGLNTFRHWFMWSAIERKPGVYDWDDCDRQLDLAAENGMGTIIAEMTQAAPDWANRAFAHARVLRADGTPIPSVMGDSAATGGFAKNGGGGGHITFNCSEVKEAAHAFLTEMANRYKGHPGLTGYDVWNECNYAFDADYSEWTKTAFREWLRAKYGDLDTLAPAWNRYSYAEWEDVMPPQLVGPYPEWLDWLTFKQDNHYDQMQGKIDTLRAVDQDCLIAAHGVAGAITEMTERGCDDWRAASKVQVYGYTWIAARKGNQPWRNFFAGDLIRGASRGKPFWHAERQGGPLWMQPQVLGRDKEDGRVAEPDDIRLWSLASFAAGARGMMNLRFRPLLDGPLFGAFGSYGMDGGRTPRSDMAASIAQWTNAPEQTSVMAAKPVRGEVGILLIPETQTFDYVLSHQGQFKTYQNAMWGAYRGFFDLNIQADWVHVDDIDGYDTLYAPYPIMLPEAVARKLAAWVEAGGTLISEACPGYFGDRGHVGTVQPNNGLDAVFGVREDEVEFMPDIGDRIRFTLDGVDLPGGGFLQSYTVNGAQILGHFDDGRVAVASHSYGKGRTLLAGTHVSVGYFRELENGHSPQNAGQAWFQACLRWAGIDPMVRTGNPKLVGRLHKDGAKDYLWIVNPTREAQSGLVEVQGQACKASKTYWGDARGIAADGRVTLPGRDALVIELAA